MKLKLAKQFFYQESEETLRYSQQPTDQLAAERFLRGRPDVWINRRSGKNLKPKTLLINFLYLQKNNQPVFEALLDRKPSPFKILVIDGTRLLPLNLDNIDTLLSHPDHYKNFNPIYKDDYEQLLRKQSIDSARCLYLEPFQLSMLYRQENDYLNENNEDLHVYLEDLLHFSKFPAFIPIDHLKALQSFYPDKEIQLIQTQWTEADNQLFSNIDSIQNPDVLISREMRIKDAEFDQFPSKDFRYFPHLENLKYKAETINLTIPFNYHFYGSIKNLHLVNSMSFSGSICLSDEYAKKNLEKLERISIEKSCFDFVNHFLQALSGAKNLKALDIINTPMAEDLEFNQLQFKNLHFLNLKGSHYNGESIKQLMSIAPNLQELKVQSISMTSELEIGGLQWEKLYKINFHTIDFNESALSLINSAPNINELFFKSNNPITDNNDIQIRNLSLLRKICITSENGEQNGNISNGLLSKLLKSSPSLESLFWIRQDSKTTENLDLTSVDSLKNLKEIYLKNADTAFIEQILSIAPNLEKLILHNCEWQKENNLDCSFTGSNKITSIAFKESSISEKIIFGIYEHCSGLQKIQLSDCEITDQRSPLHAEFAPQLPHLEVLNINTPCHSLIFQTLRAAGSKLKTLSYGDEQIEYFIKFFRANKQYQLKSLSIYCSQHTDPSIIEAVLTVHPEIEELSIFGAKEYLSLFHLFSTNTFPKNTSLALRKVNIQNISFIDAGFIRGLLKYSPNLYKITIQNCSKPENRSLRLSDIQLPSLQSVEIIGDKFLNNEEWQQLKARAPLLLDTEPSQEQSDNQLAASSSSYPLQDEVIIDADTSFKADKTLHVNRLFYAFNGQHPAPYQYRIQCFDQLTLNSNPEDIMQAFVLSRRQDMVLKDMVIPVYEGNLQQLGEHLQASQNGSYHLATTQLNAISAWQPLPGLTPGDEIKLIKLEPRLDFRLALDANRQQYQIQFQRNSSETVDIQYLLNIEPQTNRTTLPKKIIAMIKTIRNYGAKDLVLEESIHSGQDYLNAISRQKTGACRHRIIVFKDWMDKHYPEIPTIMVLNDCHAFCEIKYRDRWVKIELRGYAAELKINDTLHFQPSKLEKIQTPKGENREPATQRRTVSKASSQAQKTEDYHLYFQSHKKQALTLENLNDLLNNPSEKILVRTSGTEAQHEVMLSLYQNAKDKNMPVFWVDSADDMYCSSRWIQRKGQRGEIQSGPGGRLHDFLTDERHQHQPLLLLINYAHFEAGEIIQFNSLLDDTRKADGTALPEHCIIIGVQDINHPDCYQGSDFTSRFKERYDYHYSELKIEDIAEAGSSQSGSVYPIHLYNSHDWKQRLLGHWQVDGKALKFIEGELIIALQQENPIVIHNAPEDNESFQLLMKKFHIDGNVEGKEYDKERIYYHSGYDWEKLREHHQFREVSAEALFQTEAKLLNFQSLPFFFPHTDCDNNRQELVQVQGYIKNHANKPLDVLLTEKLNPEHWAELLDYANANQVILNVQCLKGIELPDELPLTSCAAASSSSSSVMETDNPIPEFHSIYPFPFIYSTDLDVSLSQLKTRLLDAEILFISELKISDLLYRLEPIAGLSFIKHQQPFAKALAKKERRFILAGHFEDELLQAILPLVQHYPEHLILLTEQSEIFTPFDPAIHQVSRKERWACLSHQEKAKLARLQPGKQKEHSLCNLRALARSVEPWEGYYQLKNSPRDVNTVDLNDCEQKTITFFEQRCTLIEDILNNAPFVFIGGMTGVGKSTFIHQYFSQKYSGLVFYGEEELMAWAKNPEGGFLFIDEANITRRNWSEFEGLFQKPAKIIINGQWHALTERHKVIFAGNPMSYGGSRHQASLFERHGNSVIFNPLPGYVIYQQILRPIFEQSPLKESSRRLGQTLLKAYQLLVNFSHEHVLITPRQLKSIAMLTLADWYHNQEQAPEIILHQYIRLILKAQLDEIHQPIIDIHFPEIAQSTLSYPLPADFYISKSRKNAAALLFALLRLRKFKQDKQDKLNEQQLYGDLNCFVLESQPGQGKTQLLQAILKSLELDYCHVPVTLSLTEKKELLVKAFKNGSIVIIDEINSSPMIERLLNALLSGQTANGERPKHPGFLLLGTQNPLSMGARIAQTEAQNMRMIKINLPEYSREEMEKIVTFNGFSANKAGDLCRAFENQRQLARALGNEVPNFRHLLNAAEAILTKDRNCRVSTNDPRFFVNPAQPAPEEPQTEYIEPIPEVNPYPSTFFGRNSRAIYTSGFIVASVGGILGLVLLAYVGPLAIFATIFLVLFTGLLGGAIGCIGAAIKEMIKPPMLEPAEETEANENIRPLTYSRTYQSLVDAIPLINEQALEEERINYRYNEEPELIEEQDAMAETTSGVEFERFRMK